MEFHWKNRSYKIDIGSKIKQSTNPSSFHKKMRDLLSQLYPYDLLAEEFPLCGTKPKIYADFYIPSKNLMVEVHGSQHFKYNDHFFKNKQQFYKAQARDRLKYVWCEENNIKLVAVSYDQSLEEWTELVS